MGKHSQSGRNYLGSIVTRHRQKGTKKNYILIDLKRRFSTQMAVCINFTYDINRSVHIALIRYANGIYSYILAPQGLFYGDIVRNCQHDMIYCNGYKLGYATFLINLPLNSVFFNIELEPAKGAQYARSAGTYCVIVRQDKEKNLHTIKLPTGVFIILSSYCLVTLGKASNPQHNKEIIGKAGLTRHKGFRPTVRGVAMNPVDHPHGGRTKTSSPEVTPWGKIAKRGR